MKQKAKYIFKYSLILNVDPINVGIGNALITIASNDATGLIVLFVTWLYLIKLKTTTKTIDTIKYNLVINIDP